MQELRRKRDEAQAAEEEEEEAKDEKKRRITVSEERRQAAGKAVGYCGFRVSCGMDTVVFVFGTWLCVTKVAEKIEK